MDEIEELLRELEKWDAESDFEHSGCIYPADRLRYLREMHEGEIVTLEEKVKFLETENKRQGKELGDLRKWKRKIARLIGAHSQELGFD